MSEEKDVDIEAGHTVQPHGELKSATSLNCPDSNAEAGHADGHNHFADIVRSISNEDAAERYREEAGDNGVPTNAPLDWSVSRDNAAKVTISWDENDPENPYNWSSVRFSSII
jgi:hypothetical protein